MDNAAATGNRPQRSRAGRRPGRSQQTARWQRAARKQARRVKPGLPDAGSPDCRTRRLGRRMLFQLVDEPKQVKNRWHVDVNVGRDRIDAEVSRLRGLGATPLYQVDELGAFHTTMADPEGNEFCVQ